MMTMMMMMTMARFTCCQFTYMPILAQPVALVTLDLIASSLHLVRLLRFGSFVKC